MTKKLKLVFLMTAFVSITVNAQKKATVKTIKPKTEVKTSTETKAAKPTKQETMDWIAGKMKEKLFGNSKFVSYSEGKFVYTKDIYAVLNKLTIDLNKVTGSSTEYSNDFYVKGSGLMLVENSHSSPAYINNISIGGENYNDFEEPFDFKNDDALVERLKKAFTTLIEYNTTQKGEGESF